MGPNGAILEGPEPRIPLYARPGHLEMGSNRVISRVKTSEMGSKWGQMDLFWRVRNPRFVATLAWDTSKWGEIGSKWAQIQGIPRYSKVLIPRNGPFWDPFWTTFGRDRSKSGVGFGTKQRQNEGFRVFRGFGFSETRCPKWVEIGVFGGNTSEYLRY